MISMYCRSGGTLLAKHLRSLSNTVVLSEVSPLGCGAGKDGNEVTISQQLSQWYEIEIESHEYFDQIKELAQICEAEQKNLIIRDWSFVYYSHFPTADKYRETMHRLSSFADIAHLGYYRHPTDIWLSMGEPDLEKFTLEFGQFVEHSLGLSNTKITYESFCSDTKSKMKSIQTLLPFESNYQAGSEADVPEVTGDVQTNSRGGDHFEPIKLKRKWMSGKSKQMLLNHQRFQEICSSLGYSIDDGQNNESFFESVKRKISSKLGSR